MDRSEVKKNTSSVPVALPISAASGCAVLSEEEQARLRFEAVQSRAIEQQRKEEETRALDPDAYRLSLYSDAAINGRYRRGKESMSADGLLRYFYETRNGKIRGADFSGNTGIDECPAVSEATEGRAVVAAENKQSSLLRARIRALPASIGKQIRKAAPAWFDAAQPDTSKEGKRYPVSAFAAILAVAASLMLIVASSILLTRAESNISRLNQQIRTTSGEVAELRSDFEVRNDWLEIRRIAMEEYGMVEEDYIKTEYIDLSAEDSVEVFEEEREKSVGLSAILSAIGLK